MKLMNFKIKAKSESPTKTVVTARGFKMVIDEPKMLGGENLGANPVEYLLMLLAILWHRRWDLILMEWKLILKVD
jgi:hypothetical protein